MTIIELNKRYHTIPTEWNELSQQQLLQVMECFFMRQYTGEQALLKLLKILCNMNFWQFFNTPVTSCKKRTGLLRSKQEVTGMEEYLYLTSFLFNERTGLTKQLLPVYDNLYGPESNFDNLQMKELVLCDALFMQWSEDKENISLLDDFVSLLYRPLRKSASYFKIYDIEKNPEGDVREPFNQNLSAWRAKNIISHWPINVKLAIVYWYDACRWELVDQNEEVFGSDSGGDVSKYGLAAVMLSVAEGNALGDLTSVENHYVKTVLMQIDERIRKAKAQEKAMKV